VKARKEFFTVIGLLASALLIVVLGAFFLVLPQRAEVTKIHVKTQNAQTEVASIQASRAGGSPANASQIYALSRAMPESQDLPGIVLALSRVASTTSLKLDSVRPSTPLTLSDGSSALPISVQVEGSFAGLTKFLRILRTQVALNGQTVRAASRLFIADTVSVSTLVSTQTTGASGPAGEVTATLSLVAYQYAKPVAPAPTTGASTSSGSDSSSSSSTSVSAAPQEGQ
jgi:hypothetical protein